MSFAPVPSEHTSALPSAPVLDKYIHSGLPHIHHEKISQIDRLFYAGNQQALLALQKQTTPSFFQRLTSSDHQPLLSRIDAHLNSPLLPLFAELKGAAPEARPVIMQKIFDTTSDPLIRAQAALMARDGVSYQFGIEYSPQLEIDMQQALDMVPTERLLQCHVDIQIQHVVDDLYSRASIDSALETITTVAKDVSPEQKFNCIERFVQGVANSLFFGESFLTLENAYTVLTEIFSQVAQYIAIADDFEALVMPIPDSQNELVQARSLRIAESVAQFNQRISLMSKEDLSYRAGQVVGECLFLKGVGVVAAGARDKAYVMLKGVTYAETKFIDSVLKEVATDGSKYTHTYANHVMEKSFEQAVQVLEKSGMGNIRRLNTGIDKASGKVKEMVIGQFRKGGATAIVRSVSSGKSLYVPTLEIQLPNGFAHKVRLVPSATEYVKAMKLK